MEVMVMMIMIMKINDDIITMIRRMTQTMCEL